ncbi:MAG: ABC transporter permease, partial [Prevotella sp.]
MKLESLIAVRYLFARGQKSVVHAISWISLGGLLVSTAALIIVLSVYNGIGELTKSLFNTFDPELVIEPAEG